MTQLSVAVGGERSNGVAVKAIELQTGPFAQWLRGVSLPNVNENDGRQLPSDKNRLAEQVLRLRGGIPLSGPFETAVTVRKFKKEGDPVLVAEPRVARLEVREVRSGIVRERATDEATSQWGDTTTDVQLVLALRKPGQDYTTEPTVVFDPLRAAQDSSRSPVEYVPVETGRLDLIEQVLIPGALTSLNGQVETIERQTRAYITWGQ